MPCRLFLALSSAAVFTLASCQAQPARFSEGDEADIEQLAESYRQLVLAGDYDAWANLFTDSAVYMPPNMPALEGRTAIRASLDTLSQPPVEMDVSLTWVQGSGDVAWARGTYAYTLQPAGDSVGTTEIGKFLWGLRKGSSGVWRIGAECYNSDDAETRPGL